MPWIGTCPTLRGNVTGSRPPGFTCPSNTSTIARYALFAGSHASSTAGTFAAIHGSANTRPPMIVTTVGVSVATTASINSSCTP